VKVGEGEAAPRGAKCAEPGDAVDGIEEGAGQSEGVEDFRAGRELFEVDGTEGDLCCAESLGDRGKSVAGAARTATRYCLPSTQACSIRSVWLWMRVTISSICADC